MTTPRDPLYAGYRYPAELINYAVWLYFRFPLSLRWVEEMLAARSAARQSGDQEGFVLDVLVQSRRDKKAAKRSPRKLLKKQGRAPRALITDKRRGHATFRREIMPGVEHRQHKGRKNRAKTSYQPTRRRERIMKWFKSPRQVPRFLSTHDQIANVFSRRRNQDTAARFHAARSQSFATWAEATGMAMAAQSRR